MPASRAVSLLINAEVLNGPCNGISEGQCFADTSDGGKKEGRRELHYAAMIVDLMMLIST